MIIDICEVKYRGLPRVHKFTFDLPSTESDIGRRKLNLRWSRRRMGFKIFLRVAPVSVLKSEGGNTISGLEPLNEDT